MKAIPLFLKDDVVSFIDQLCKRKSAKHNREVSRSEVVDEVMTKYWISLQKTKANAKFEERLAQKQMTA